MASIYQRFSGLRQVAHMKPSKVAIAQAVSEPIERKIALLRAAAAFDATRLLLAAVPESGRLPA